MNRFKKLFSYKSVSSPLYVGSQAREPHVSCFRCGKRATRHDLLLFPWWHEHMDAFVSMYYCAKCVHNARRELTTMLKTRHEDRLNHFITFVEQQQLSSAALRTMTMQEVIPYIMDIIERIAARKILLNP